MKLKSDNDDPDANPCDVVVGTKFVVKIFLLESLMSPLLIFQMSFVKYVH